MIFLRIASNADNKEKVCSIYLQTAAAGKDIPPELFTGKFEVSESDTLSEVVEKAKRIINSYKY